MRRLASVMLALAAAGGCGGGDGEIRGVLPAAIEIVSGNNQSGAANARLAAPLVVRVLDATGAPLSRVRVGWTVSPGGSVSSSISVTDVDGKARVDVVLGAVGSHTVVAGVTTVLGLQQLFTLTATNPPVLTTLQPQAFGPGDTVVATGTDLVGPLPIVTVGEAVAEVVSATATSIRFVAPNCAPGGSQPVVARIGTATTNALTATVQTTAAPLALAVGQYLSIDPAAAPGCARFPAAGADTVEYLLVPQAATRFTGRSTSYRVGGAAIPVAAGVTAPAPVPGTAADAFHELLRARERELARMHRPRAPVAGPEAAAARLGAVPVLGSSRTFKVCGSTDPGAGCEPFQNVIATARYVGRHAAVYVDQNAPAGGLTDADLSALGKLFDERLYEVASRAFGAESDLDENGVVIILMTGAVNRLTPREKCSEGFISGFFFGFDLVAPTDPRSNKGEVFYSIVADPSGTIGCTHSADRVRRLVPVTFIHEFQHMISFNQHVLIRGGLPELVWLNEGLSHFGEELGGRSFLAEGDEVTFSRFVINNLLNAFRYFKAPTDFFLLAPDTSIGTLEERGAAWTFVRWLVDQFGVDVTRRLVETGLTGGLNVEAVTGAPFSLLVAEWALAIWADDLPAFTAPPALRLASWDLRTTYAQLHRDQPTLFDRPFPIVPPVFANGATLVRSGTLRSGSPDYLRVRLPPFASAFSLAFTDASGLPLPSVLVPRLTALRTR